MSNTPVLPELLANMGRDGPMAPLDVAGVPVVVAWGEHDQVIPYGLYGAPFQARIAGLTEQVIAGAGHVPMLDNPQQIVASILALLPRRSTRMSVLHDAALSVLYM